MSAKNPAFNTWLVHAVDGVTVSSATTTDSSAIDTAGFTEAELILSFGTTTGTSGTATVSLVECDTSGGTYAAISGATTTALTTDSGAQTDKYVSIALSLLGRERYLKVRVVTAGTVNTGAMDGFVLLGGSEIESRPPSGKTARDTTIAYVGG